MTKLVTAERMIRRLAAERRAQCPVIVLCFDAHRADGKVRVVKVGRRWKNATRVQVRGVTLKTVYRGPKARQPRAYLTGRGRVVWQGSTAVLWP